MILAASGVFVLSIITILIVKRKSIKAYFASIENKKEWARKRLSFLENMNEAVNPFTGYQMITYTINGRRNEKAIMSYNIPLEDLNCKNKWRSYTGKDNNLKKSRCNFARRN